MAIQDAVAQIVGGSALEGVKDLIGEFHESPEQKAADAAKLDSLSAQEESITAARDEALANVAGANIQAEAKSGDKFVERARPTFLYLMYALLAYSFVFQPLVLMVCAIGGVLHGGLKWSEVSGVVKPLEIPGSLFELFGAGYLGYGALRSTDKATAAVQAVSALPGDSQTEIKLPFGLGNVKVGNKSAVGSGK